MSRTRSRPKLKRLPKPVPTKDDGGADISRVIYIKAIMPSCSNSIDAVDEALEQLRGYGAAEIFASSTIQARECDVPSELLTSMAEFES